MQINKKNPQKAIKNGSGKIHYIQILKDIYLDGF